MDGVTVRPEHVTAMRAHGEETYPHECCGFLVGERVGEQGIVRALVRATNARADSPRNRYLISPEEFMRVQRDADRQGLDIVGFYHSHPDAPARPSEFDRDQAWPHYAYFVLGVAHAVAGDVAAFALAEDRGAFTVLPWRTEGEA